MIQILEVKPDGTAVVSTEGLFRVVVHPSGRIVRELCEQCSADAFAGSFNGSGKESWAEVIDYADVFQRVSSA